MHAHAQNGRHEKSDCCYLEDDCTAACDCGSFFIVKLMFVSMNPTDWNLDTYIYISNS